MIPNFLKVLLASGQAGPEVAAAAGPDGDSIVSELRGRFYRSAYRGNLYSGGMAVTSINNATFTTATLGATCTPIIGVWNPLASTVYLSVLQAILQVVLTALQNTGGGPYMWATSVGNGAISTGNAPFNRKTFLQAGSQAKDMSGVALTGLTNNLAVRGAAGVAGGNLFNIATLDTAAGFSTPLAPSVENCDGAWLIPPGGVLALLASITPVAQSAGAGILWDEVVP